MKINNEVMTEWNIYQKPNTFKREDRYVIIKRKDLHCLSLEDYLKLDDILAQINYFRGLKGPITTVVVEHDWPEYETVWKMIEDRCNNE